ncbi:DUF1769-domain-containing protein [Xylariaceae sp. FL0594]|nr:DUF1769-domain-containing protein [Xylariaceae sp. FL0594]
MADKYVLRVTAGSDYNIDKQVEVPVNSAETVKISSDLIDAEVNIRVQGYAGLPKGSPETSPYFDLEPHSANDDQYSIAIRFTLKRPRAADAAGDGAKGISGHDLQFGNDFDHPIRDRLPPGFSYALNLVKWWVDPGLDGDPYADKPYLYGPALSSFNTVHAGAGDHDPEKGGLAFDEGGDDEGMLARRASGAPEGAKERKKWALGDAAKTAWLFEYERPYCVDFFNAYLDFKRFAVRLPGYYLPVMKYWDGQGLRPNPRRSHALRYVLRNRTTDETYLVIVFSLHLKEDINNDGTLKPAVGEKVGQDVEAESGWNDDVD